MYRQALPGHDLSIEQGTANVPDDGYYDVLRGGVVQGRFRSLAQATKCYAGIRETLKIEPPPRPTVSAEEMLQRELAMRSNKSVLRSEEDFTRVDRKTKGRPKH